MQKSLATIAAFACLVSACGGSSFPADVATQTMPVVSQVDPSAGAPGDTITVFGFGFSSIPQSNVVVIGGAASAASEYRLLEEPTEAQIESITATVPEDAQAGEGSLVVLVHETPSNADVTFTVTE